MNQASLSPARLSPNDLVTADALALSEWIRLRKVSCREVMTAFLDHIERVNTPANAIVSLRERATLLAQRNDGVGGRVDALDMVKKRGHHLAAGHLAKAYPL